MRRFLAGWLCVLGLAPCGAGTATPQADAWSGAYRLEWIAAGRNGAQLQIARAPDDEPRKLLEKHRADLVRWTISEVGAGEKGTNLRRYTPAEYESWGWAGLHEAGRIECLDATRIFVCRTDPDTTIHLGREGPYRETLALKTGVFGVGLHAGAFELTKLEQK